MDYFKIDDDEKFQSIVKNANILGLKINHIKVIYSIHLKKNITQREIEKIADLRQPEVSIALNQLNEMEFIKQHSEVQISKGRPIMVYKLNKPIYEIFMEIKKQKEKEILIIKLAWDDLIQTIKNI